MANEYTYRADHIGTLIMPGHLSDAHKQYARGELALNLLREVESKAIKSAVDMQRTAGLSVMTDGGFRRIGSGAPKLEGSTLAKDEAASLRSMSRRPIKVAVPAARPAIGEPLDRALDRAAIVKQEIDALIAAGVDYVQLDAPGYAALFQGSNNGAPQTIDALLQLDVVALSGINRPGHVRIAVHFVRPDHTVVQPSADRHGAVERLFQGLLADRFILPMDGKDHDFELLRLVPKGKLVVLGLLSAANSALEDVDDLMARIDRAAKLIDGNDLALSPATGFVASAAVSESDQRRKFELIAEVTTRWWGFAM